MQKWSSFYVHSAMKNISLQIESGSNFNRKRKQKIYNS